MTNEEMHTWTDAHIIQLLEKTQNVVVYSMTIEKVKSKMSSSSLNCAALSKMHQGKNRSSGKGKDEGSTNFKWDAVEVLQFVLWEETNSPTDVAFSSHFAKQSTEHLETTF